MTTPTASSVERIRDQRGLTIVEVIIAALILALGAMATFGVLGAATKNTQRAKATQVALDRAQQELEAMRSLPNKALALTTTPQHANSPLNPNYRVSGNEFATVRTPEGGKAIMVVNERPLYGGGFVAGGTVIPGPVSFTSGDVSGKIYRYVVWRDDVNCPPATCPGPQDYKQIVVAVKLDTPANQSGERGYVEVTSAFIDPTDSALNDPIPGANGVVTAQQLFLSDTPCAQSGATLRLDIIGDHPLHNTLGTCASGLQTGSEKEGAPDALLPGSPPDPDPVDASNPLAYDYSNDIEPTPNTDAGVQVRPDDSPGCHFQPSGTSTPESQVHRWVADPIPATLTEGFKMTGNVTLEFYSQTLNGASHTATLCVFLFKRHEVGSPPKATDTRLTDKSTGLDHWKFSPGGTGFWWKNEWHRERFTMSLGGTLSTNTIPAGDRLGIALAFDRATTPAGAVQIMYDHPKYPTRIEVETNTPFDGG
jgi:type II secretory pathway pseudopilin PulG